MSSNNPKRHHYIPKILLNNFLDDKNRLWVYDKEKGKLYPSTPKNIFVQKNLYRILNFDGDYSYEAEEELSRIESRAAPVIRRIIQCARNNENPKLSMKERHSWMRFYIASCRRSPEFVEEMLRLDEEYDDVLHTAFESLLSQQLIDPLDREFLDSNPILSDATTMKQNIKAVFASGDHPRLQAEEEDFLHKTGLLIAVSETIPGEVVKAILDGESPLRVWRKHREFTLAALADQVGVSKGYLSQVENGQKPGTLGLFSRLAGVLNVALDELAHPTN